MAEGLLGRRQRLVRTGLQQGIAELKASLDAALNARATDLQAQRTELLSLRGKSRDVLLEMRERITREQRRFEEASTRMAAIKTVYRKLFQKILDQLQPEELLREMQALGDALARPGLKWDIKKIYGDTFARLQSRAMALQSTTDDLQGLQTSAFTQLNADYGFMLQPVASPSFSSYQMDLELTKRSHLAYVGFRHALRMQRADFVMQAVRALFHRLEALQATARDDAQQWRLSAIAQLEAQTAMRRAHFLSRLDTVEKIERAAANFDQRLGQIMDSEKNIQSLRRKLSAQAAYLIAANEETVDASPVEKPSPDTLTTSIISAAIV